MKTLNPPYPKPNLDIVLKTDSFFMKPVKKLFDKSWPIYNISIFE